MPRVKYFTMGLEQVAIGGYVASGGGDTGDVLSFERRQGQQPDGRRQELSGAAPAADKVDPGFAYDPMNPVPSFGGNVCCTGNAVNGGAYDQRKMESRGATFWSTRRSR